MFDFESFLKRKGRGGNFEFGCRRFIFCLGFVIGLDFGVLYLIFLGFSDFIYRVRGCIV